MDDLFERVKGLNISVYIETETKSKSKKVGSTTRRLNPCPFCHHNDSFTIYSSPNNSFSCFSCQRGGSIIDFEMMKYNISDPLEAAKSIARKTGISLDSTEEKEKAAPAAKKKKEKLSEEELPAIDPKRAVKLRGLVADFFHSQLVTSIEALSYQIDKRGHSIEVLKQFKVGYIGKESLIKHLTAQGYQVEDLIGIGLVAKATKGYRPKIKPGRFIYPQLSQGHVVYFSVKDPEIKSCPQIEKRFAGKEWFCFNQDVLEYSKDPVILVEGPDDLLTIVDRAKQQNVVSILGNYNIKNILTRLKECAENRTFFLCFDKDSAGEAYTVKYAKAILEGGGEVRVINFPGDPGSDIDDYLKSAQNPVDDFKKLMENATVWTSDEKKSGGNGDGTVIPEDPYSFSTFDVLGELEDNRLCFESKDTQKLYILPIRDLTLESLVQIGGLEVNKRVVRTVEAAKEDGKVHLYDLRKKLILKARETQLGPLRFYGQGINLLEDETLLIVNGKSSYRYDGKSFEPYNSAMIENRLISKRDAARWIDFERLMLAVGSMNKNRAREVITSALSLFQQWRFCGDCDVLLITGFLFSQFVQAIWLWRPHLWLSGPAGSGKTLLINLFEEIGGALSRRFEGNSTSEAGFRQSLKHDFGLALIDEFERSDARDQIISYLRTAGRGGPVIKGSPGQEAIAFELRHMCMVSSIETALVRAAERTRFLVVELYKDDSRNPQIPNVQEMERLRIDFFAFSLWAAFRAKTLIRDHGRLSGYDPRLCEAFGVPLSMIALAEPDPEKYFKDYMAMVLEERLDPEGGGEEVERDEVRLLSDILESTIRVDAAEFGEKSIYAERPIAWLLQSYSDFHQKDAEAYGIKKCEDGVFFSSNTILRKLLKDTPWRGMNISGILKRLPGATITQRRMNNRKARGVLVPYHAEYFGDLKKPDVKNEQDELF